MWINLEFKRMNVLGRDIKALQRVFGAFGRERRGSFGFSPQKEKDL